MIGGRVVAGVRLSPTNGRHRLTSWITQVKRGRQLAIERHLELVEQTERLERRKRQSGAYVPVPEPRRRW